MPQTPITHDILLIGGGHSHVEIIRQFGMKPVAGARLTLVTRDVHTPYSGMLPGLLAGHYSFEQAHIDLARLCSRTGVRLIHAPVTRLNLDERSATVSGRPALRFDSVSIDIGSAPDTTSITGADNGLAVKPVDVFRTQWAKTEAAIVERGSGRIVVAGAGAGGVELALSLQHRLSEQSPHVTFDLEIVSRDPDLLPGHADGVRAKLSKVLEQRGVVVHRGRSVVEVEPNAALLDDGTRLPCDRTLLVTGAAPEAWLREAGLQCDERGFVQVDDCLRSVSHPFVFAAGDCASFVSRKLPKAGVFAVRQGPVLASNFRRLVANEPLEAYRPQRDILALISTGDRYAIASRGGFTISGKWVWRWKDHIDRTWMERYQNFPIMAEDEDDPMRCGGCGAKVPASVLREVVEKLDIPQVPGLLLGVDAPDDAAAVEVPEGQVLVQSVDQFRAFTQDPWLFARIAANHCLGDLYAMGARPHSALATVTLPFAGSHILAADLEALLHGALEVLREAGATLAGGHTAEGAELAFGLTVNGFATREQIMRKSGATLGDRLILTKPIGTGVILAADMRGEAQIDDVEHAYASMLQSNQKAGEILRRNGAKSCTDVTGFGLAGHLDEIARASGVTLNVSLADVPVLPGAESLTSAGFQSTLTPANAGDARFVERQGTGLTDRWQLLFDPQTAGGLVAAVPAGNEKSVLQELYSEGFVFASTIGECVDKSGTCHVAVL